MTPTFCTDLQKDLTDVIERLNVSKVAVLVDENTKKHCFPLIEGVVPNAHSITIKSGEQHKTFTTCAYIWDQMTKFSLDRKSLLINLGGGVIGDMGGFCAATYKRGISFINLPTTLLSQVDASVGGKLGIDFNGFKNHIGLFKQPDYILIHSKFLQTLPEREIKSGFAEIIKHAIIANRMQWEEIKSKPIETIDFNTIIEQSVKIKENVVNEDPLEKGIRKILNFGHTIGHAIETTFLNSSNPILHGEAVAAGMICESCIALKESLITQDELDQIVKVIDLNYSRVSLSNKSQQSILTLVAQDKKNEKDKILMALPKGIGSAVWDIEVSPYEIQAALEFYNRH